MIRKFFSRYRVEAAFATAVIILLAAGFLAHRTMVASGENERQVLHTYEVINTLDQLSAALAVVDSASRSFALTGDDPFLRVQEAAALSARRHLSALRRLAADNAEQQSRLRGVEQAADQDIAFSGSLITLRRTKGLDAAITAVRSGIEASDTDGLRTTIDRVKDRELQVLANRSGAAERSLSQSDQLLALGTVLGLLITAAAGIGVVRDGSRRRAAEEELYAEKERAQVTLTSIADGVIRVDDVCRVTFLNRAAERITGWPAAEALGRPISEVFPVVDFASRARIPDCMQRAVMDGSTQVTVNALLIRRDGVEIPLEDSVAPIHSLEGEITGAVKVFRDVSSAREMTGKLQHAAQHDALTGLPNRILLDDRIAQAITRADRQGSKLAVLFLDLDGFKQINDFYGHATGDALLKTVSAKLQTCVRECDTVSRVGGDEFVVVVSDLKATDDAAHTALRIAHALDDLPVPGGMTVTASIGISIYPENGSNAETLLKHADSAMYGAKAGGRKTFRFYDPTSARLRDVNKRRALVG